MNFIVKADNPTVGFSVGLGDVTDSEGNPTDGSGLGVEIVSTDEVVVKVNKDADGKSGTVEFGSPGVASVQITVTDKKGTVIGSGGAGFTVTAGDPAAISAVNVSFDGLQPTEEAPVEETPVEPAPPAEENPTAGTPDEGTEEETSSSRRTRR